MIFLLFFINPFFAFFSSFFLLLKKGNKKHERIVVYIIISLFYALLAYTQKSNGLQDTDIIRYYNYFNDFSKMPLFGTDLFYNLNLLFVGFDIVSRVVVNITRDVKFFSLFWTFVSYIYLYLSIENFIRYRRIRLNNIRWFFLIVFCTLCLQLFTQVTETYKQAVSLALFFYGFTLTLLNRKKVGAIYVVFAMLCHLSTLLCLIMYLPHYINHRKMWIVVGISGLIGLINSMNIMTNILNFIGSNSYFLYLLINKSEKYGEELDGFSLSFVFVIQLLVLIVACLYIELLTRKSRRYDNLFLPFLCLLLINLSSAHNFDRSINLASFPMTVLFIDCLTLRTKQKKLRTAVLTFFVISMLFVNTRKTYFRTLDSSGYTSSYMDNSIPKIILSPSFFYFYE